jgi:hypothetical protein
VYCSIDKIDLEARVNGRTIAVQTDHRTRREMEAEPELSVLFAMARVVNARGHLEEDGHAGAAVHYAVAEEPPSELREALGAAGGTLERAGGEDLEPLGPGSEVLVGELADRSFAQLARRAAARVGSRDLAIALRMLEDQTHAAPPDRTDEPAYWSRVLELAALAGELVRAKYAGHWIQTDRALVPFGFELSRPQDGGLVVFPTNRAQRVIEDGPDESLFKLLVAADETIHHPSDASTGRLMPSLRARRDVELDEVLWRALVDEPPPRVELPIIVCGIDGESTFGMIRREALARSADGAFDEALANLAAEPVQCEELTAGGQPVVVVTGSFYAAEKLLDTAFLAQLQQALGADRLVAAAPGRGCLLVSGAAKTPAERAHFAALARARYDSSGGRAISPAVVVVEDGRITGYVRGSADRPDDDPEGTRADTEPPAGLRRWHGRK